MRNLLVFNLSLLQYSRILLSFSSANYYETHRFMKNSTRFFELILSNREKISSLFQARDFSANRGAKTGVIQGIMRIFVTKSRDKRSALNQEVIISTLLSLLIICLMMANQDERNFFIISLYFLKLFCIFTLLFKIKV